ncbi:MAG: fused MFS/spermidine synthase, partial [Pseudomonadota bacterium]
MTRNKSWFALHRSSVEVSEEDGVRSLHLGGNAIQSSIRLARPDELALDYTRAMMAFLLFQPLPREVLMIGLGGGSMARYIHQRMPGTRTTVIEINAKVLAAARSLFHFPADDARLKVEIADGADYIRDHAESADVLLVDGFDDGKQPATLCTQAFYDAAYAALRPGGVMAVNFMAEEKKLDVFLQRIEKSFDERVIRLKAADRVNLIAFAFKRHPSELAWSELKKRAQ